MKMAPGTSYEKLVRLSAGGLGLILGLLSSELYAKPLGTVVQDNRTAVIFIKAEKVNQTTGALEEVNGTGFLVNKEGYVLTSAHVIASGPGLAVAAYGAIGSREGQLEKMDVLYENSNFDVAVLKFRNTAIERKWVTLGDPWSVDEAATVYAMGFPGEQEWFHTEGKLSGKTGPKGSWSTTVILNLGMSGGPIFDTDGKVVAMVWGGVADKDINGINLILPVNLLVEPLRIAGVPLEVPAKPKGVLERAYRIGQTQESLGGLTAASKQYVATYTAQPGFRIVDYTFVAKSANNASDPIVDIAPDGKSFTIRYSLTSGPLFDRWRGWLDGELLTRQVKE